MNIDGTNDLYIIKFNFALNPSFKTVDISMESTMKHLERYALEILTIS